MRPLSVHERVVVVGAGHAGFRFVEALRELGWRGPLALVDGEAGLPYERPPLSKEWLLGDLTDADATTFRPASFYDDEAIERIDGDGVVAVDRAAGRVRLASGRVLGYDRLVLATGAELRPIDLPGADFDGVVGLRTRADAVALRERMSRAQHLVVIGGGYIGLEVASAASRVAQVTVLERGSRVLRRSLSAQVAEHLAELHRRCGVDLRVGGSAEAIEADTAGRVCRVRVARDGGAGDGGEPNPAGSIAADLVVVGIGVAPRDGVARDARLPTDDGVLVDEWLATPDARVHAIGDVARMPHVDGGTVRIESVPNAGDQARFLARRLVSGDDEPYRAVPWFWTVQHGVKVQVAGLARPDDDAELAPDATSDRFSVARHRDGRLVAVESVARPRDFVTAKKRLAAGAVSVVE